MTVEGSGMGGRGNQDFREILKGSDAVGTIIRVGYMGDVSMTWEEAERISTKGDIPTDGAVAETEGGWELVLPTFGGGDGGSGFGVGGYVCCPPP